MIPKTFETADGSVTCFDEKTGEHYHNKAGAYSEAQLNYVEPSGLLELFQTTQKICLLDVPFGMGYNTFALLQSLITQSEDCQAGEVHVVGIESDHLILQVLDEVMDNAKFAPLRNSLNQSRGQTWKSILEKVKNFQPVGFQLGNLKVHMDLRQGDMRKIIPQLQEERPCFDAVFHDPFSPNKMPELWTADIFKAYRSMMPPHGRITTYSVSVIVKGGLAEAGFSIYGTTPLGEKSGGTVASATALQQLPSGIYELAESEADRLQTKSGVPFRDPSLSLDRAAIRNNRLDEQSNFKVKTPA